LSAEHIKLLKSKDPMKSWICLGLLMFGATARAEKVGHHEGASEITLSGDGKVAFSKGVGSLRVWDVNGKRELASLPSEAGALIAVSEDGGRVLCRRSERKLEGKSEKETSDFVLWRRNHGEWQKGTLVRRSVVEPLLSASFTDDELVLLWGKNIERRAANGRLLRVIRSKELEKNSLEPSALSADGTRAVVFQYDGEKPLAVIFDTSTGRSLQRLLREQFNYYTSWAFSPNADVVGAVMGEPVGPWNPDDGPQPVQWTQVYWDTKTGKEVGNTLGGSLNFWPNPYGLTLVEKTDASPSKSELIDLFAKKVVPLPFPQPWGERKMRSLRFSRDGKRVLVVDDRGDLWVEQVDLSLLHSRMSEKTDR
jgi:hypothetical protein